MAAMRCGNVLAALLFSTGFTGAHGHGYLSVPMARSGNNNGLNGGWATKWCGGSNGKKAIRATYTGGQVAEFQHVITAHHFGHLEMTICNTTVGNNCANAFRLIRAEPPADCSPNDSRQDCQPIDALHPERFHLPPRRSPQTDRFRYIIPADLQCEECTVQWRWWTANSGVGANDYGCYWDQISQAGWNSDNFHGYFSGKPCGSNQAKNVEQFVGCSDVRVLPGGPTPAPPPPTPAPPTPPTPQPTLAPPTPQPTPAPAPSCCKWSGTCGGSCASGYCSQSVGDCNGCGGTWCNPSALAEVRAHTPEVTPQATIPLTVNDCGGSSHIARLDDYSPKSVQTGVENQLNAWGTISEDVTGGRLNLNAAMTGFPWTGLGSVTNHDICTPKNLELRALGIWGGSMLYEGMDCPVSASQGSINLPIKLTLASILPGGMANTRTDINGTASNGKPLLCATVTTSR